MKPKANGKPVPAEVLADYPDLKPKATPESKPEPVPPTYRTPQARALAEALWRGDLHGALAMLQPLSFKETQETMLYAGFGLPSAKTKAQLIAYLQPDLLAAARARKDGFELHKMTQKAFPPHARILFFTPRTGVRPCVS